MRIAELYQPAQGKDQGVRSFLLITTKIESAMKYPKLSILAGVFVLGTAFGIYVVSQDRLD